MKLIIDSGGTSTSWCIACSQTKQILINNTLPGMHAFFAKPEDIHNNISAILKAISDKNKDFLNKITNIHLYVAGYKLIE